jgi:hypothetical protein
MQTLVAAAWQMGLSPQQPGLPSLRAWRSRECVSAQIAYILVFDCAAVEVDEVLRLLLVCV